jgi:hypothetical protein
MSFNEDNHLDVCQNIEFGLKQQYETNPRLTDRLCILSLDNAKIAIKQRFGYAQNESVSSSDDLRGVIDWCVSVGLERIGKVNELTLKEFVARLDKIKRSVALHSGNGKRSYYEFIRNYLP